MEQSWDKVASTLFQRRTPTLYQLCATLKIWRRLLFHFQRRINVISTEIIRRWNVGWVRIKARYCNLISTFFFLHITYFSSLFGFFVMIWKRRVVDLFILFTEIVTENSQVIFFFLLKHYNGVHIFQLPLLWKMNLVNKCFLKISLLYLQIYQI